MYTIHSYGAMIRDEVRSGAYVEALRRTIRPSSIVLDIGTGPGIWALLACRFGARKVYAIEPADIVDLARELAAVNSCADRIDFIQNLSINISLPEKVDTIVSEIHGALPLFENSVASIMDARKRFLAQGGTLIPARESLWAAVVDAADIHQECLCPWDGLIYDLDFRPGLRFASNLMRKVRLDATHIITDPVCWADLDYMSITSPDVSGDVDLCANRAAIGHGFCVWFDSVLVEGVSFSNSPGSARTIFGQTFFPWPTPVPLVSGDTIRASFLAKHTGHGYVWCWNTTVSAQDGTTKAEFRQSDAFSQPVSLKTLHRRRSDHVPALSENGAIDLFILQRMDGKTSLEQIAHDLQSRFPDRFPDFPAALTRVGELSQRYSM